MSGAGYRKSNTQDDRDARVRQLFSEGVETHVIASRLGIGRPRVNAILRAARHPDDLRSAG